jgi:hypothetical protein
VATAPAPVTIITTIRHRTTVPDDEFKLMVPGTIIEDRDYLLRNHSAKMVYSIDGFVFFASNGLVLKSFNELHVLG